MFGKNFLRTRAKYSLAVSAVSMVVVCLGCVLILLPLWFVLNTNASVWLLIIPAALFLLIVFVGAPLVVWGMLHRRNKALDAVFEPLGLTGSSFRIWFRQYAGTFHGREVHVYIYRNPVVEIDMQTSLQTRLGMTRTNLVTSVAAGLAGKTPVRVADPELQGVQFFPLDPAWMEEVLREPRNRQILQQLVQQPAPFDAVQLILRPGTLRAQVIGNPGLFNIEIPPEQARAWLENMAAWLSLAESAPAPTVMDQISAAERTAASIRKTNLGLITAILVAVLLVGMVGTALAITLLLVYWRP